MIYLEKNFTSLIQLPQVTSLIIVCNFPIIILINYLRKYADLSWKHLLCAACLRGWLVLRDEVDEVDDADEGLKLPASSSASDATAFLIASLRMRRRITQHHYYSGVIISVAFFRHSD